MKLAGQVPGSDNANAIHQRGLLIQIKTILNRVSYCFTLKVISVATLVPGNSWIGVVCLYCGRPYMQHYGWPPAQTREEKQIMEWPAQISELQQKWVEQQQQLLNDWLGTLQNTGGSATLNAWRESIDVIEQQVNSALKAQKQSLKALIENTENIEGVPEPFTQLFHQLEDGIELWNEVQHRLWQVWFDMLRTTAPVPQTPGETLIRNWQDMAQRAMSIQEQWLSNWTGQIAASSKPGKKSTKPSDS